MHTEQIIAVGQRTNVRLLTCNVRSRLLLNGQNGRTYTGVKYLVSVPDSSRAHGIQNKQAPSNEGYIWKVEAGGSLNTVLASLRSDRDKRHVSSLYCTVCRKYEDSLQSLKSFSRAWIVGSTNHKVSNLIDHATSEVQRWLAWERMLWRQPASPGLRCRLRSDAVSQRWTLLENVLKGNLSYAL